MRGHQLERPWLLPTLTVVLPVAAHQRAACPTWPLAGPLGMSGSTCLWLGGDGLLLGGGGAAALQARRQAASGTTRGRQPLPARHGRRCGPLPTLAHALHRLGWRPARRGGARAWRPQALPQQPEAAVELRGQGRAPLLPCRCRRRQTCSRAERLPKPARERGGARPATRSPSLPWLPQQQQRAR